MPKPGQDVRERPLCSPLPGLRTAAFETRETRCSLREDYPIDLKSLLLRSNESAVSKFFSLLMAIFLVACPQLCRAEPLGCCAEVCDESSPDEHSGLPEPVQAEAISCICAGAIQNPDPQPEAKTSLADWSPLPFTPPSFHSGLSVLPSVIREGAPPGGYAGGPHRIHLLVQNFRC